MAPRSKTLLQDEFLSSAKTAPLSLAVESHVSGKPERFTYRDLDTDSSDLSDLLVSRMNEESKPEWGDATSGAHRLIVLLLPRGYELYAAMLAILKSGCGYVPLDPAKTPPERLEFILNETRALLLVTSSEFAPEKAWAGSTFLCDRDNAGARLGWSSEQGLAHSFGATQKPAKNFGGMGKTWTRAQLRSRTKPSDVCYVIFTSGSTGTPKGVLLSHENVLTYIAGARKLYALQGWDRVLQGFSPCFDASVEEMWMGFSAGACLVVGDAHVMQIADELPEFLRRTTVTAFSTVPSLLQVMPATPLPDLRLLIVGGEACGPSVLQKWSCQGRRFLNTYGPTECAVVSTATAMRPGAPVTIGVALSGYQALVLPVEGEAEAEVEADGQTPAPAPAPAPAKGAQTVPAPAPVPAPSLRELPAGQEGELCVVSRAVSTHGYLHRPELNARKFFKVGKVRMYRTGDLVKRDEASGELLFLGRIDSQVKIRGFRVELGEIEAALCDCPGVVAAAAHVQKAAAPSAPGAAPGADALVAFLVLAEGGKGEKEEGEGSGDGGCSLFDPDAALRALKQRLPCYMVPSVWATLKANDLPRLASGKINRRALPRAELCDAIKFKPTSPVATKAGILIPGDGEGERAESPADRALAVDDVTLTDAAADLDVDPAVAAVLDVWSAVLQQKLGAEDSFFDFGGHSALAAQAVSELRQNRAAEHPELALLGIRDVYEGQSAGAVVRSVRAKQLAEQEAKEKRRRESFLGNPQASQDLREAVSEAGSSSTGSSKSGYEDAPRRPRTVQCLQVLFILFSVVVQGGAALTLLVWIVTAVLLPLWYAGDVQSLCLYGAGVMFALPPAMLVYSLLLALLARRVLIGRGGFAPLAGTSHPIWSMFFFRWWLNRLFSSQFTGFFKAIFHGTPILPLVYRRVLGARIGRRVYINCNIESEWELISIGDDASIQRDTRLKTWTLRDGFLTFQHVHIGAGAHVGVRCVVAGGAVLEEGAKLLSFSLLPENAVLPAGETYNGCPAAPVGEGAGAAADCNAMSSVLRRMEDENARPDVPRAVDWESGGLCGALCMAFALYAALSVLGMGMIVAVAPEIAVFFTVLWPLVTSLDLPMLLAWAFPLSLLSYFSALLTLCAFKWAVPCGRLRAGPVRLYSFRYFQRWVVDGLMHALVTGGLRPFTETLLAKWVFRALGAKVGKGSEISDSSVPAPDLFQMGENSMLADGGYVGLPVVHAGFHQIGSTGLGDKTFLGNNGMIPISSAPVGNDALIGVQTVAPGSAVDGTAWIGNPAISLPRRDRRTHGHAAKTTFTPPMHMYVARALCNVVKIGLPGGLVRCIFWTLIKFIFDAEASYRGEWAILFGLLSGLVLASFFAAVFLLPAGIKWLLAGRIRRGTHPLWSVFIWKFEISYEVEMTLFYPARPLFSLTPFLPMYYRLTGARIGRNCLMAGMMSEPDLVTIGDDFTMETNACIQCHLFEDRVMKLGTIKIGSACHMGDLSYVLFDTEMEDRVVVDDLSLMMKNEKFGEGCTFRGMPAQLMSVV